MNAKMIIGICLVVFIIAGLIFLKIREKKAAKGVDLSLDEIHSISNGLSSSLNNSDELDEDDLDFVAGGATTVTTTVTTVVTTVTTVTKTVTYDWAKIKRYFRRW